MECRFGPLLQNRSIGKSIDENEDDDGDDGDGGDGYDGGGAGGGNVDGNGEILR